MAKVLLYAGLMLSCLPVCAVTPTSQELAEAGSWAASTFDADAALPFSFVYGGQPSSEILTAWKAERAEERLDACRVRRTAICTDPKTSMSLACEAIVYSDYPVVEWRLDFENHGTSDSPILSEAWAADFVLTRSPAGEFVLHHADGSQAAATDFQPHETPLGPNAALTFSPEGGRSSDGVMPYFNVVRPGGGVLVAVGWTGQWAAAFARDAGEKLTIRAGMERTHLLLHPGERIRTPAIILMFYSGDPARGHNLWRQFMLRHCSPMLNGNPAPLPVAASAGAIPFNTVSETNQVQAITNIAAKALPVDTWWIDAGWTTGGFPEGMGTWDPDPDRFPKGLGPVGDAAHAAGLKFLAWFEPERVMPGSWLRLNRPDWLLTPAGLPGPLAYQEDWRLLDLGNPEALAWAKATLSRTIGEAGIDIYRHDCNLHPLYYWRAGEAPDRQGMREIRYVEGLYDFFDTLVRDHPGLLVDNCASGGRRLDFEMMRRSVPLWRTDYCWDPVGAQSISYALSYWLPQHGLGAVSVDPYDFRSGMGSSATYALDFYSDGAPFWPVLAERIEEYLPLRKFFSGDYYPLTPYSASNDTWIAWQYDRSDLGQGMVQAFRRAESPEESLRVTFHGLDAGASYEVVDLDKEASSLSKGGELMTTGMVVILPNKPAAVVITYRKSDS